jgi:hypothetical protein
VCPTTGRTTACSASMARRLTRRRRRNDDHHRQANRSADARPLRVGP